PVRDIQDLRIAAGCETIRCTQVFLNVSVNRRVTVCIQENDEHFQHLL
ncbi:hypothetical protein EAG_15025, partial [Camponotus floridanus]